MKPHMAHIHNTMIKKKLAKDAGDVSTTIAGYRAKIAKAQAFGFPAADIIEELRLERESISKDIRAGEAIFLQGVVNAKRACIAAIDQLISELKGDDHE